MKPMHLSQETLNQFHAALQLQECPQDVMIMNMALQPDSFDPMLIRQTWLPIISNLKPTAHNIFWKIVSSRNKNKNIGLYKPNTKTESNRLTRAYKELNQKELIKRIGQGQYLINPDVIVPTYTYPEVVEHWQSVSV